MYTLSFVTPIALVLLLIIPLIWLIAVAMPRRGSARRHYAGLLLRSLMVLALVLGLAGTQIVRPVREVTTVFLLDASDSVAPTQREQATTFINAALAQMPAGDQAALVVFGENALVERAPDALAAIGRINSVPLTTRTDLQRALQLGLALFPSETQKRIVLLSDGGENNGSAADAARLAALRGIPIDTVLLPSVGGPDVILNEVTAPASAREGQDIVLGLTISSSYATSGRLQIFSDGQLTLEQPVTISAGQQRLSVRIPAGAAGFRRLEVRLDADGDSETQNNRAAAFTEVQGPPLLLLVAAQPERASNLLSALQAVGVRATVVEPNQVPATLDQLGDYAAVVLVDTPARDLPRDFLLVLPAYVQELGRGLAMIGGVDSYGAGGYRRAPADATGRSIEDLLPVDLDPRDTSRQPDLALMMVIDRSGSMAEADTGTRTKLDLAKEAVYQASLGLNERDQIGLVAFDDQAQTILPIQKLPATVEIERALSSFNADGGTNIRPGIELAATALATSDARIKHVLLLTDGLADSNYSDLIDQMRSQGITISAIAIGTDTNPNLEDVALRGGGRFLRVERAEEVPALFLQETVLIAGRDIIEEPVTPVVALQTPAIRALGNLPTLYGFNGVEPKQAARTILVTADGRPLLAQWQTGLGRAVAWTSDMQGKWARDWVQWQQYPNFVASLVDLLVPPRDTGQLTMRSTTTGAQTVVELAAAGLDNTPLNDLVIQSRIVNPDGQGQPLNFTQVGPGQYRATTETGQPGVYLAQVAAADATGNQIGVVTTGIAVSYSLEYGLQRANPQLLRDVARISGGRSDPTPAAVFERTNQAVGSVREIGLPLLWFALLLWPFDIGLRRLLVRLADLVPWLVRRKPATHAEPTLGRLQGAKQRAEQRMTRPVSPPVVKQDPASAEPAAPATPVQAAPVQAAPPEPAPAAEEEPGQPLSAEERYARLLAAKQRAKKR